MTPSNADPPEGIKNLRNYLGLPPTDPKDPQAELREMMLKIKEYWTTADGEPELKDFAIYVIGLVQAHQQELLSELLGELPPKSLALRKMYKTDKEYYANLGFNAAVKQVVSVIEAKRKELQ